MRNRLHRSLVSFSAFGAIVGFLACETETLDLGSGLPDASQKPSTAEAGGGDDGSRLIVDDEPCTISSEARDDLRAPSYGYTLTAFCPRYGTVRLKLGANADDPYPQTCGGRTNVYLGVDIETDAAVLAVSANAYSFRADDAGGSCTVTQGPTAGSPATPARMNATVVDLDARQHRVVYTSAAFPESTVSCPFLVAGTGPGRPVSEECGLDAAMCRRDENCPSGLPCSCAAGGRCLLDSTCALDSDCPSGQSCVLSDPKVDPGDGGIGRWGVGYFCTTPVDHCSCCADPGASSTFDPTTLCAFDLVDRRWACNTDKGATPR